MDTGGNSLPSGPDGKKRKVSYFYDPETGVALGMELEDKMPQHEYYEYFGPDYTLHVAPSNMENKNSRQMLEDMRAKLLDNLSKLQHAPSVPFQERPPDTEFPEADEDEDVKDERWNHDSDVKDDQRKPQSGRVKREILEPEAMGTDDMQIDERPRELDSTFTDSKGSIAAAAEAQMQGNSNKAFDQPVDMNL
nr:histone deacetylase 19 [Ipomoea batatas]